MYLHNQFMCPMKKVLLTALLSLLSFICLAQSTAQTTTGSSSKQKEVLVPTYKLFATQNMWIFLKLDTSQGLVRMVQYSMESSNRLEVPINYLPLATGEDAIPGRFNLYPTQNMWTFIMLDEVDGRTWQVQWSTDGKEGIAPINAGLYRD